VNQTRDKVTKAKRKSKTKSVGWAIRADKSEARASTGSQIRNNASPNKRTNRKTGRRLLAAQKEISWDRGDKGVWSEPLSMDFHL
jgi:hypothetical protein